MREIQPRHIHARAHQVAHDGFVVRCRPHGADDLGATVLGDVFVVGIQFSGRFRGFKGDLVHACSMGLTLDCKSSARRPGVASGSVVTVRGYMVALNSAPSSTISESMYIQTRRAMAAPNGP